jgi:hypothetical protein
MADQAQALAQPTTPVAKGSTGLTNPTAAPQKKVRQPVYWAIELDNEIFSNPVLAEHLAANTQLVPLKKIHSTLLYVGKNHEALADKIALISSQQNKKVLLEIDGFGHSDDACALSVKSITIEDIGETMPSYPNKHQHVTIALKDGIKPVESVETLVRENRTFTEFPELVVLHGTVRGMFY